MRRLGLRVMVLLLGAASPAVAQGPAAEPAGDAATPGPSEGQAPPEPAGPAAEPSPGPVLESAPAPEKTPEQSTTAEPGRAEPIGPVGRAKEVAPQSTGAAAPSALWVRARSPLTLEGKLGFLVRPESSAGFDDESHVGAEYGLSLYMDLRREIAAGLELERASLGRGTAESGASTIGVDYSVTSAMLGFRAYPKRSELIDLFVGLQLGVGIQGVSAAGTRTQGPLLPPVAYRCGGSGAPAFQIGGGVGARFMISPRWGITGRVNGTGRRLTADLVDDCAQGIGNATTVSASIGLGYDFDLDR